MKLAVFFPGIGYSNDMPLLYYTTKMASNLGYDFIKIEYHCFPSFSLELMNDEEKLEMMIKREIRNIERRMKEINYSKYEDILFVSKSIGTVISSIYDSITPFSARHIHFTPLIQAFELCSYSDCLAFYSDCDPYQNSSELEQAFKKGNIKSVQIENANHSLETGNTLKDLETMKLIMGIVKDFINKK